MTPDYFQ